MEGVAEARAGETLILRAIELEGGKQTPAVGAENRGLTHKRGLHL